jgi:hypothetical protein
MANPSAAEHLEAMAQLVREASPRRLSATGREIRESFERVLLSIERSPPIEEAIDAVDDEWRLFMRVLEQSGTAGKSGTPEAEESRERALAAIARLASLLPDARPTQEAKSPPVR